MRQTQQPEAEVWMPQQVHGARIYDLSAEAGALPEPLTIEADAVVCNQPGQWIGVRTADCVPVLLYDAKRQIVAAVHAGWRGTVQHIVAQTIQYLKDKYHTQSYDLWAMIGPSISTDNFEVGPEVAEAFTQANRADCIRPGAKPHIDLWQSNVMDLLEEGVELEQIDCSPICTYDHTDILYSARKEGIGTGRNITAIRLK